MVAPSDDELNRALVTRDRLRARLTWWERWRGAMLVPIMAVGGGAGFGVGRVLRVLMAMPEKTEFFCAVLGVVVAGRAVSRFFDAAKLDVARRRVEAMERGRKRG